MNPDEQIRWYCLQLAANCAADDTTIDDVIADAQKLVFFVRVSPPAPQAVQ